MNHVRDNIYQYVKSGGKSVFVFMEMAGAAYALRAFPWITADIYTRQISSYFIRQRKTSPEYCFTVLYENIYDIERFFERYFDDF